MDILNELENLKLFDAESPSFTLWEIAPKII